MIRTATADDVDALIQLIQELAEYEGSLESVRIDRSRLTDALFAEPPFVFAHVAEEDGRIVGMAIWYLTFST